MSLITLAVVGKDNNPLYIRDFGSDSVYEPAPEQLTEQDPFGFFESQASSLSESSSLKNQFIMHSALDRLEELTNDSSSTERSKAGLNSMWIGLLGCFDEAKVYGYVTSTKIKFIASIEDIEEGNGNFVREAGLKVLFANTHELYVEYTLNPFSQVRAQKMMSSQRFDNGVAGLVTNFNDSFGKKGMSWM
eukprot:43032_1